MSLSRRYQVVSVDSKGTINPIITNTSPTTWTPCTWEEYKTKDGLCVLMPSGRIETFQMWLIEPTSVVCPFGQTVCVRINKVDTSVPVELLLKDADGMCTVIYMSWDIEKDTWVWKLPDIFMNYPVWVKKN